MPAKFWRLTGWSNIAPRNFILSLRCIVFRICKAHAIGESRPFCRENSFCLLKLVLVYLLPTQCNGGIKEKWLDFPFKDLWCFIPLVVFYISLSVLNVFPKTGDFPRDHVFGTMAIIGVWGGRACPDLSFRSFQSVSAAGQKPGWPSIRLLPAPTLTTAASTDKTQSLIDSLGSTKHLAW